MIQELNKTKCYTEKTKGNYEMYRNRTKNYPYYEVRGVKDLRHLIDDTAGLFSEKKALIYKVNGEERSLTYKNLKTTVDSLGSALCKRGLGDTHIGIIGENSGFWIIAYLTTLNLKGVVVPIDKDLGKDDLRRVLTDGDVTAVFYASSMREKLAEANVGQITDYICMDRKDGLPDGHLYMEDLILEGGDLLAAGDRTYVDIVPDYEGLKQLMFTSGTTGKSKGVMLSQKTLCFNIIKSQELMKITERCLSVLPYHHAYEATCGILTMLHHGMTIVVNDSLRNVVSNLKKYKPTEMLIVPLFAETFYRRIMEKIKEQGKEKTFIRGLKLSNTLLKAGIDVRKKLFGEILENFGGELLILICGGAPLKPYLAEFFDGIGIMLINGYGITECGPLVAINRPCYHKSEAVGLPIKDIEIRIDNPNEKGEGEICVKGDNVMLGYYKNRKATDEVIVDGWFHTGDIGKFDSDGFLYITGRIKNMIVLKNGENIYPEEIEDALSDIELISEVIVYGAKLSETGDKGLGAEIYPDFEAAKKKGVTDVQAAIREEISKYNAQRPHYKTIKEIRFRDTEFEKTTSKKIKRKYDK